MGATSWPIWTLHPTKFSLRLGKFVFIHTRIWWASGLHGNSPMSLRRCEWRVCGRGQTTSKPSIHNAPFCGLWNCSGNPRKPYDGWNFSGWKINVCKMKGLIVHPIVWEHWNGILKVPTGFPKFSMEFPGLELMASTLGSTFRKEELGVWFPPTTSPPLQVTFNGLSLKIFIQYSWVDGGEDFIQHGVIQALPEGKRSKKYSSM